MVLSIVILMFHPDGGTILLPSLWKDLPILAASLLCAPQSCVHHSFPTELPLLPHSRPASPISMLHGISRSTQQLWKWTVIKKKSHFIFCRPKARKAKSPLQALRPCSPPYLAYFPYCFSTPGWLVPLADFPSPCWLWQSWSQPSQQWKEPMLPRALSYGRDCCSACHLNHHAPWLQV